MGDRICESLEFLVYLLQLFSKLRFCCIYNGDKRRPGSIDFDRCIAYEGRHKTAVLSDHSHLISVDNFFAAISIVGSGHNKFSFVWMYQL